MSFLTAIFYPTRLWDGSSKSRTTADGPIGGIHRKPDAEDYAQMLQETIALQTQLGLPFQTVAHASTIAWDPTLGLTTKIAATGNETINAASVGPAGQRATFIFTAADASARTITFGTNFAASATVVRGASLRASITFVSDGTTWIEVGRLIYA
jgi:hypothetical protein